MKLKPLAVCVLVFVVLFACNAPSAIPTIEPLSSPSATPPPPASTSTPPPPPPTATSTPTQTPRPTSTPTATRRPATATPIPTATRTATRTPVRPSATPVPSTPPLANTVQTTLNRVNSLGGALDRLYWDGGAEACKPILSDYYGIANAPTYDVSAQPANVQNAYASYREAVSIITQKFSVIRSVCESGGGTISRLDFDVARMAINDAADRLNAALRALGR